jgi:hypothetical protein
VELKCAVNRLSGPRPNDDKREVGGRDARRFYTTAAEKNAKVNDRAESVHWPKIPLIEAKIRSQADFVPCTGSINSHSAEAWCLSMVLLLIGSASIIEVTFRVSLVLS